MNRVVQRFPGKTQDRPKPLSCAWSDVVGRLPAAPAAPPPAAAFAFDPHKIAIANRPPAVLEPDWLNMLDKFFHRAHWHSVLTDILTRRQFLLPAPDRRIALPCQAAVYGRSKEWIAYLFTDRETPIWLFVQYTGNLLGCLLPRQGIAFSRAEAGAKWAISREFLTELAELSKRGLARPGFSRPPAPATALVFSGRPYHFIFDHLGGLLWAEHNRLLAGLGTVLHLAGTGFFDLSQSPLLQAADPAPELLVKDRNYLDDHSLLLLHLNVNPLMSAAPDFGFFEKIRNFFHDPRTSERYRRQFAGFFPVVWFGLTGQKRAWLEQRDGFRQLAEHLNANFERPLIVVDGWTRQLADSPADQTAIEQDMQLYRELADPGESQVECVSLIGRSLVEKAAAAGHIDGYIANMGSGCLFPSLIAGKKGVLHTSQAWYNDNTQRNLRSGNSVVFAGTNVCDRQNPRKSEYSYSIPAATIVRALSILLAIDQSAGNAPGHNRKPSAEAAAQPTTGTP